MEYDNDRKINRAYKAELFFWISLVALKPLVTTVTVFWFFPAFSIALLLMSLVLFPAYLLYARFVVYGFLLKKKYLAFAALSILSSVLLLLLAIALNSFILKFSLRPPEEFYLLYGPRTLVRELLWILINLSLCVGFCIVKKSSDEQISIESLEKSSTLYRLKYLQSQLNPHFLFNALNSIYALSLEKSDQTPDVVIKLADMMRYLIDECSAEKIALDKEIEFIRSYIEIEKVRYKADVRFTVEGDTSHIMIEPFLFISFIENGFKHAMNDNSPNPFIYITIRIRQDKIELNVVNNTNIDLETQAKRINGIGIRNSRSLLEILYPESHVLQIIQTDIQPRPKSSMRIKNATEYLKMFYPDSHTLDVILNHNAFTVSLVVNAHAS
jgi:two-component system, LytTR family, sensor kinase